MISSFINEPRPNEKLYHNCPKENTHNSLPLPNNSCQLYRYRRNTLEREINAPGSVLKPFAQLLSEILLPKIRNPETKVEQEEANSAINGTQGSSTSAKDKEKKAPVSLSAFLGFEEVRETQSPHACDHCDKRFELQWDLHVHLKKVHSIESYHACQQCPRVFTRREDFERHLITHGERKFKCRVCGMTFLRLQTLDRHTENHHDLRKEIANNSLNIISSLSLGEKESETQQRKVDTRASTSSCVQSLASIHNDKWRKRRKGSTGGGGKGWKRVG